MGDNKIELTADNLITLAEHAKKIGTEHQWMSIAIEWIKYADAEIARLQKELES